MQNTTVFPIWGLLFSFSLVVLVVQLERAAMIRAIPQNATDGSRRTADVNGPAARPPPSTQTAAAGKSIRGH